MNQEELKQGLIELALTDIECNKDGHGDCSMCEYRYADDKCVKYYAGVMTDFFIKSGVTIRERGEWLPIFNDSRCSVCGYENNACTATRVRDDSPFCPHCGADMRGGKDE